MPYPHNHRENDDAHVVIGLVAACLSGAVAAVLLLLRPEGNFGRLGVSLIKKRAANE